MIVTVLNHIKFEAVDRSRSSFDGLLSYKRSVITNVLFRHHRLVLHLDRHLNELIQSVGAFWVYLVVFAIVFCETGLVVFPFLPGDSYYSRWEHWPPTPI